MFTISHALSWHSQLAKWFCVDDEGNLIGKELLKQRMRKHIHAVVGRYKGRVQGWDVVNEAIEGNGQWRNSPFYQILGEEYIPLAFQYAQEADPDVELYYNDYGMASPAKRDKVVELINMLKQRGIRIDAIGRQSPVGLNAHDLDEY